MEPRYFRPVADSTRLVPTATGMPPLCTTTLLPAGGVILVDPVNDPLTLVSAAIFQAACPTAVPVAPPVILANSGITVDDTAPVAGPQFTDFRDPFYATTFPICYALSATTVVAYTLVIVLFIAPRSFLDGGVVYLGRRGFTSSTAGSVSIGGRPWLQKIAALTVAISLTIATADTFRVAEQQYAWGYQNATQMQMQVMDGTELKVIRLVSDTFLWLAQAQTLIRLFPRHREKVIIKWTAFALITLDVIFSALNSFQDNGSGSQGNQRPRSFVDAIPALSYLFQLSLGLLYAAWVIYYALMKKRYAFYHPLMKNMCLVATISIGAVIVPVVFFVLDISKPLFTGWGDYVRWVGAAAASVVVWEWVERIEALEREEKKDGILGREVFEGDEMLEVSASEFPWLRRRGHRKPRRPDGGDDHDDHHGDQPAPSSGRANLWPGVSSIANRYRSHHNTNSNNAADKNGEAPTTQRTIGDRLRPPLWPSRPAPAVTPVSRTDTVSADSTVYAVRYQPVSETTSRTPDPPPQPAMVSLSRTSSSAPSHHTDAEVEAPAANAVEMPPTDAPTDVEANATTDAARSRSRWRTLAQAANPLFHRSAKTSPPEAVQMHVRTQTQESRESHSQSQGHDHDGAGRWDLRARFEDFAATQADRLRERIRPTVETSNLPVMVIPAPPRRGAALAQVLAEQEQADHHPQLPAQAVTTSPSTAAALRTGTSSSSRTFPPLQTQMSNFSGQTQTQSVPQSRAGPVVTSPLHGPELPPGAPPMWPGVRPRGESASERRLSDDYSVRSLAR